MTSPSHLSATAVRLAPTIRPNCGSPAGAHAHSRHGEARCQACRSAASEDQREYRDARRSPYQRDFRSLTAEQRVERLAQARRAVSDHRMLQLATKLESNADRIDSRDAATALRFAARAIRRELGKLDPVTAWLAGPLGRESAAS